jgi:hypothetical protein
MTALYPLGVPLTSYSRGTTPIDSIVLHESVTRSRAKTVAVLQRRKLGVHIIVERDGSVTQHADFAEQCAHAGSRYNRRSIAVEVVNPYYGSAADDGEPDIAAVWAHRGWYVLPSATQLEAVWGVVEDLVDLMPSIAARFPGADLARGFRWGRYSLKTRALLQAPAGIVAHARWDHSDGLVPEHYCLMRWLDWSPEDAYRQTVAAASSGQRVTPIHLPLARTA